MNKVLRVGRGSAVALTFFMRTIDHQAVALDLLSTLFAPRPDPAFTVRG